MAIKKFNSVDGYSVGDVTLTTVVDATGNVTATSTLTRNTRNVPTFVYQADTAPTSPLVGDQWYNTTTGSLFEWINDGTNLQWVDMNGVPGLFLANIAGSLTVGALTVTGTSNLNAVGNITITGGSSGQVLQTNGSGVLTWATVGGLANGTSNVAIPAVNGNVNTSVNGNANIFIVTGTGANVTGTLNASGAVIGQTTISAGGNIDGANLRTAGLVTATGNITGGNIAAGSYVQKSVGTGLTAAGSTQGTALVLTTEINNVTTTAASTGVLLPNSTGTTFIVMNNGANQLAVYPTSTAQIDAGGANVAYTLAVSAKIMFVQVSATQYYTV